MTEVGRMSGQLAGNEAKRQAVVEKMWLHYYNHVLLQQGLITENQHHMMQLQIISRKSAAAEQ